MGGLPLFRVNICHQHDRQAYVPAGLRTRNLLLAKRIRHPLHHRAGILCLFGIY